MHPGGRIFNPVDLFHEMNIYLLTVDQAQTGHYPELSGNAGYGWTGRDFPLENQWSVGASLNFPLFNGFLTTLQVAEARANLVKAKANEDAVRQARENRELSQGRYDSGVGGSIEVTDALPSEIKAETASINSLYFYRLAIANLEKAMGVMR